MQKLIEYKPGWTLVDPTAIVLPPRLAALSDADVSAALEAAKPLPLDQIQKVDSLTPEQKMRLGYGELVRMAREKYEGGCFESYAAAEKDVLDTCGGMFAHAHISGTFQHGKALSGVDKQTVRAWRAARHFSSLATFNPKQLLVVEDYEDKLNLAACHLQRSADAGRRRALHSRRAHRVELPELLQFAQGEAGLDCLLQG